MKNNFKKIFFWFIFIFLILVIIWKFLISNNWYLQFHILYSDKIGYFAKNIFSNATEIEKNFFLTSYHSVVDEKYNYFINNKKLKIIYKNQNSDIAFLTFEDYEKNFSGKIDENYEKNFFKNAEIWEKVFIYSQRNWNLSKIEWKIINKNVNTVGVFDNWKNYNFQIRYLTDLTVQEGDSWTAIFNEKNEIIDIIHISNNKN